MRGYTPLPARNSWKIRPFIPFHGDFLMTSDESWRSHYPFKSYFLDLPEGRLHYVDEGEGDPLLLVHGNPTWSFHWRKLIAAQRDRYRVIALDHMGCGLSDKPRDWQYDLSGHIQNLGRLLTKLNLQRTTLIAHDWGGPIGLGTMLEAPERFSRLILLNTGAWPPRQIPWRIRVCRTPIAGPLAVRGFNLFLRAAFWMALSDRSRLSPEEREGYAFPYGTWSDRLAIARFVADIPDSSRHRSYATLAGIEQSLKDAAPLPALLVWGMQDWCFTPACLERMAGLLPHAEILRIDRAGHWVLEDAFEQVRDAISDFLARSSLTSASNSITRTK